MAKRPIQFVPPKQARQLTELAERARLSLSRFAGVDVEYNAVGLQLLDEWVDRHLRQFPKPSGEIITVWGAFLGETFRRRFNGEWVVNASSGKSRLGVLCPKEEQGRVFVDVMDQMQRRIREGMSESLAFYYTIKGVEIKSG
ncbi:MAG: hypothetical protein JXA33_04460 [Anaerolineae bacterium]|nr:hypothetical protein [Anaerolineae bacterium]